MKKLLLISFLLSFQLSLASEDKDAFYNKTANAFATCSPEIYGGETDETSVTIGNIYQQDQETKITQTQTQIKSNMDWLLTGDWDTPDNQNRMHALIAERGPAVNMEKLAENDFL